MLGISSCIDRPSVYRLWKNVHSGPLPQSGSPGPFATELCEVFVYSGRGPILICGLHVFSLIPQAAFSFCHLFLGCAERSSLSQSWHVYFRLCACCCRCHIQSPRQHPQRARSSFPCSPPGVSFQSFTHECPGFPAPSAEDVFSPLSTLGCRVTQQLTALPGLPSGLTHPQPRTTSAAMAAACRAA